VECNNLFAIKGQNIPKNLHFFLWLQKEAGWQSKIIGWHKVRCFLAFVQFKKIIYYRNSIRLFWLFQPK